MLFIDYALGPGSQYFGCCVMVAHSRRADYRSGRNSYSQGNLRFLGFADPRFLGCAGASPWSFLGCFKGYPATFLGSWRDMEINWSSRDRYCSGLYFRYWFFWHYEAPWTDHDYTSWANRPHDPGCLETYTGRCKGLPEFISGHTDAEVRRSKRLPSHATTTIPRL